VCFARRNNAWQLKKRAPLIAGARVATPRIKRRNEEKCNTRKINEHFHGRTRAKSAGATDRALSPWKRHASTSHPKQSKVAPPCFSRAAHSTVAVRSKKTLNAFKDNKRVADSF